MQDKKVEKLKKADGMKTKKLICEYCGKQIPEDTRYVQFSMYNVNKHGSVVNKYYHYLCYLEMLPNWEELTLDLYKK